MNGVQANKRGHKQKHHAWPGDDSTVVGIVEACHKFNNHGLFNDQQQWDGGQETNDQYVSCVFVKYEKEYEYGDQRKRVQYHGSDANASDWHSIAQLIHGYRSIIQRSEQYLNRFEMVLNRINWTCQMLN